MDSPGVRTDSWIPIRPRIAGLDESGRTRLGLRSVRSCGDPWPAGTPSYTISRHNAPQSSIRPRRLLRLRRRSPNVLLPRFLGAFSVKTFPPVGSREPRHDDLLISSLLRLRPLGDFLLQRGNIAGLFVGRINVRLTVAAWQRSLNRLPLLDGTLAQAGLHRTQRRMLAGPLGFVLPILL